LNDNSKYVADIFDSSLKQYGQIKCGSELFQKDKIADRWPTPGLELAMEA
jgi:hypothetical protein